MVNNTSSNGGDGVNREYIIAVSNSTKVTGEGRRNKYVIKSVDAATVTTITNFNPNRDVIDLSAFPSIRNASDLFIMEDPLTLILPNGQQVVLSSMSNYNLNPSNFIFGSGSQSSSSSSKSGLSSIFTKAVVGALSLFGSLMFVTFLCANFGNQLLVKKWKVLLRKPFLSISQTEIDQVRGIDSSVDDKKKKPRARVHFEWSRSSALPEESSSSSSSSASKLSSSMFSLPTPGTLSGIRRAQDQGKIMTIVSNSFSSSSSYSKLSDSHQQQQQGKKDEQVLSSSASSHSRDLWSLSSDSLDSIRKAVLYGNLNKEDSLLSSDAVGDLEQGRGRPSSTIPAATATASTSHRQAAISLGPFTPSSSSSSSSMSSLSSQLILVDNNAFVEGTHHANLHLVPRSLNSGDDHSDSSHSSVDGHHNNRSDDDNFLFSDEDDDNDDDHHETNSFDELFSIVDDDEEEEKDHY